jgi:putative transposase
MSKERERNMLVAEERFIIASWPRFMEKITVSTDGDGTWYPQACRFLRLSHHNHSPFEKSVIERTMQ